MHPLGNRGDKRGRAIRVRQFGQRLVVASNPIARRVRIATARSSICAVPSSEVPTGGPLPSRPDTFRTLGIREPGSNLLSERERAVNARLHSTLSQHKELRRERQYFGRVRSRRNHTLNVDANKTR